jgi:hypothetical protein
MTACLEGATDLGKLGFIHYNGGLQVYSSLFNIVLHD